MQVLVVQRAQVNHTCLPYVMLRFNRHGGSREPVWEHQWAGRSLTSYQRTCWILVPQFRTAVGNDACSRGHAGHRSDRGDTEYSSKNRAVWSVRCGRAILWCTFGVHTVDRCEPMLSDLFLTFTSLVPSFHIMFRLYPPIS